MKRNICVSLLIIAMFIMFAGVTAIFAVEHSPLCQGEPVSNSNDIGVQSAERGGTILAADIGSYIPGANLNMTICTNESQRKCATSCEGIACENNQMDVYTKLGIMKIGKGDIRFNNGFMKPESLIANPGLEIGGAELSGFIIQMIV